MQDILPLIIENLDYASLTRYKTVSKLFCKLCTLNVNKKSSEDFIKDFNITIRTMNYFVTIPFSYDNVMKKISLYPEIFKSQSTSAINRTFSCKNPSTKKSFLFNLKFLEPKINFYGVLSESILMSNATELFELFTIYDIIPDSQFDINTVQFIQYMVSVEVPIHDISIESVANNSLIIDSYIIQSTRAYGKSRNNINFIISLDCYCGKLYGRWNNILLINGENLFGITLIYKYILSVSKQKKATVIQEPKIIPIKHNESYDKLIIEINKNLVQEPIIIPYKSSLDVAKSIMESNEYKNHHLMLPNQLQKTNKNLVQESSSDVATSITETNQNFYDEIYENFYDYVVAFTPLILFFLVRRFR